MTAGLEEDRIETTTLFLAPVAVCVANGLNHTQHCWLGPDAFGIGRLGSLDWRVKRGDCGARYKGCAFTHELDIFFCGIEVALQSLPRLKVVGL